MRIVNLYRYERAPRQVTTSPIKPDEGVDSTVIYRLIADDEMAITNGTVITTCADVDSVEGWTDCALPEDEIKQAE